MHLVITYKCGSFWLYSLLVIITEIYLCHDIGDELKANGKQWGSKSGLVADKKFCNTIKPFLK